MPTNPSLVPTPIVDRNGKPTTVHRKPQQPASGEIPPAPSPAAVGDSREAVVERVAFFISEMLRADNESDVDTDSWLIDMYDEELRPDEVQSKLELYTTEFLQDMEQRIRQCGDDAIGIAEQLAYGESAQTIRESIYFYDQISGSDYRRVSAHVESLRLHNVAPLINDLTHGDEKSQATLLAAFKVYAAIDDVFGDPMAALEHPLKPHHTTVTGEVVARMDDALINLIRERPEDGDRMVEIVTRHRTADPQTIRGMLNGFVISLVDGSL